MASPFLTGRVWILATQAGMAAPSSWRRAREALGSRRPVGEPRAERPQRGAADREADLGHRQVTPPQQPLGPLDPARHQVAVGRLTEGSTKAAGEMARRQEGRARQRRNIQRLGVVAVHQVTGPAQPDEVIQPHTTTIPQRQAAPVSAQWRPGCSNAQTAEDTPHRLLRAARSESCRGLASRIDARAPDRPPEALTGQLKRSITGRSSIGSRPAAARSRRRCCPGRLRRSRP